MKSFLTLKNLIKVLISLVIIWVLFTHLNSATLWKALTHVNPLVVVSALFFYLFCQFICAKRWQTVAQDMGLIGGVWEYYQYYLMGMFFGLFLPTAIGGDVAKAAILSRAKNSTMVHALLSMLAERMAGLISLLAYVVLAFNMVHPPGSTLGYYVVICALFVVALFFAFYFRLLETHPWTRHWIARFITKKAADTELAAQGAWPGKWAMSKAVIVSLIFHGASIALQYGLMSAVGIHVTVPIVATVYGISGLASMIPAFGGIGPREGAIVLMLHQLAQSSTAQATAFSIVWLGVLLLAAVPGGILILLRQVRPEHAGVTSPKM